MAEEKQRFLTEGLLITAIPAAGYWFAYVYELGFCKYFQIPTDLIELTVPAIVGATISIAGLAFVVFILFDSLFSNWLSPLPRVIKISFFRFLASCLVVLGFSVVNSWTQKEILVTVLILIVPLFIIEFVLPLFTEYRTKGYIRKLEKQHERDSRKETSIDKLAVIIGKHARLGVISFYLISLVAYFSGGYSAKTMRTFSVVSNNDSYLILKKYDDTFITAEYDSEKGILLPNFLLVSSEKIDKFHTLNISEITPLKLKSSVK